MKKANKNPVLAAKQRHGIKNIHIIKILAFLREYFKYIFFTCLFSTIGIYISEIIGRYIAYIVWG